MQKNSKYHNDFIVDRLTNSIQNRISGDSFITEVSLLGQTDLKQIQKKNGWLFNWKEEHRKADREIYKLTILNSPAIIQGIASLSLKQDHVFLNLIENAPFNKGQEKVYEGVAGNLVAFACKLSFQRGYEGFVSFHSKTNLVDHYIKSLHAKHFGNLLMVIDTPAAQDLVNKYYKY